LPSGLRSLLKLLLNRTESGPDRQGSNTVALLGLAPILALVLHHPSAILHLKGLVHHPLEFLKVTRFLGIGEAIIQTIEEACQCPLRLCNIPVVTVAATIHLYCLLFVKELQIF
jgi:hypothetical protein